MPRYQGVAHRSSYIHDDQRIHIASGALVILGALGLFAYSTYYSAKAERAAVASMAEFCAQSAAPASCEARAESHHDECFKHIDATSKTALFRTRKYIACVELTPTTYYTLMRANTPPRVVLDEATQRHVVTWRGAKTSVK